MKINYTIKPCYIDGAGNKHESKLEYLMAERQFAMRSIVNNDDLGRATAFTPNQVVKIMLDNATKIADVAKTFDKAIRAERAKANVIVPGTGNVNLAQ